MDLHKMSEATKLVAFCMIMIVNLITSGIQILFSMEQQILIISTTCGKFPRLKSIFTSTNSS